MKLQKILLLIAALIAFAWGIFGLFFPQTLMILLKTPLKQINPSSISTHMTLAIAQIALGIIAVWMYSLADKKLVSQAMTVVAAAFLLFGLEAVLAHLVVEGLNLNVFLFVQGIAFIVLAGIFFLARKPK
jgi:hypothetical protein